MTGLEACEYCLRGGKVRKPQWAKDRYVVYEDDSFKDYYCPYINTEGHRVVKWRPRKWDAIDLLDTWEPYEDPKPAEKVWMCWKCGSYRCALGIEIWCDKGLPFAEGDPKKPLLSDCWHAAESEDPKSEPPTPPDSRFWIVWCPEGKTPPQKRHSSYVEAKAACEAMAKSHPGHQFFPLGCNKHCIAEEVPVEPGWEKAWKTLEDAAYQAGGLGTLLLKEHDPRGKTELRAVWKKAKGE